jgi:hypothetical protein
MVVWPDGLFPNLNSAIFNRQSFTHPAVLRPRINAADFLRDLNDGVLMAVLMPAPDPAQDAWTDRFCDNIPEVIRIQADQIQHFTAGDAAQRFGFCRNFGFGGLHSFSLC